MIKWPDLFSVNRPEIKGNGPTERFERKFYLDPSKIDFAAHLLSHCCRRDVQYPRGTITSVYYDTPDLELYDESEQGVHSRRKVRIRWYDDPAVGSDFWVYVELKCRKGYAGTKHRTRHLVESKRVSPNALREGILPYDRVATSLAEFGYFPRNRLEPVMRLSYQRLRFVDIATGARVSLDWDIRATAVSPLYGREGSARMEGGVIEIKGRSADIPETLGSIRSLGTDWSRYSKYATCVSAILEGCGTAGRMRPSGRMERPMVLNETLF